MSRLSGCDITPITHSRGFLTPTSPNCESFNTFSQTCLALCAKSPLRYSLSEKTNCALGHKIIIDHRLKIDAVGEFNCGGTLLLSFCPSSNFSRFSGLSHRVIGFGHFAEYLGAVSPAFQCCLVFFDSG